jgi:multiple sugar transport system permease protein
MVKQLLSHAVLISGALFMLAPFVVMIVTSLKSPGEIFAPSFTLWPAVFTAPRNYAAAFEHMRIARQMANATLVCGAILALQVATGVPCAFALAKCRFRGRALAFALVLICMMVPIQVPAIPLYLGFAKAGLLDSYAGLILPFGVSAFGIFLLRQYFLSFSDEVIEAAKLDGYHEMEIIWLIVVPSSGPAIASFAIFELVYHWNDLYWPLVVVTNPDLATLPLGLASFKNQSGGGDFGVLMAAATCVTLPLLIAFLFAQRSFARGIAAGVPR